MVEAYIETKRKHRPSHRTTQMIGQGPDQSGPITLIDGTTLDLDLSGVSSDNSNRYRTWPITLKAHEDVGIGARLDGRTVYLDENGMGQEKLDPRRQVIIKLDHPIRERQNGVITSEHYPDYPEQSYTLGDTGKDTGIPNE